MVWSKDFYSAVLVGGWACSHLLAVGLLQGVLFLGIARALAGRMLFVLIDLEALWKTIWCM